jgi:perosamine synthetase
MLSTEKRPKVKIAKPFNDDNIERSVVSILRSGMLVQGEFVKQFESRLSEYIGCRHVIAVNSGTAALQVALAAAEASSKVKNGEVITSPLSFAATANAAIANGLKPVFADVDPETFNVEPSNIEEKISDKTIALEPVDVYGLAAELREIKRLADKKKIPVVEDAAEAIGAKYQGKNIGNISNVSCFSTYATKNLHTGEGGFVTTNEDSIAEQVRLTRNQGQSSRYNQKTMGYNFRMLEICAAIGLGQLSHLDELNENRRTHARMLSESLEDVECLGFQRVDEPANHAWYMFAAILDEKQAGISRDKFVQKLRDEGVEPDVSWPTPIHLQPYYRETFGYKEGDFPIAERVCQTVFQLPIQPFLTEEEIHRVVSTIKTILSA